MRFGYTVKDMILITLNTTLMVALLVVYCQSTGFEARKKRAKEQLEKEAENIVGGIAEDMKVATRNSIEMVLIQENPPTVKIGMQILISEENKIVPVTYFMMGTTLSRVMRRKKKVLTKNLYNLYMQNEPASGEFHIEVVTRMGVEGLDFPLSAARNTKQRPLDEVPDDVIVETEEGLEVDTSLGEDAADDAEGMIDLYLKYSESDVLSLEKERSDVRVEMRNSEQRLANLNDKLSQEVPGIKHVSFQLVVPEITDTQVLEKIMELPTVAPDYKALIDEKIQAINFFIDQRKEIKIIEEILEQKKTMPIYDSNKVAPD